MGECEKIVSETVQEIEELNEETVKEYVEDVLEILKITLAGQNESVGYILVLGTGGPYVELNTRDRRVYCEWYEDHAEKPVSRRACILIDEYLDEVIP